MTTFAYLQALRGLDDETPEYFKLEVWAHARSDTLESALVILKEGLLPTEAPFILQTMIGSVG